MSFVKSETGAVTVDWVVLTAGLVGLGLAVSTVVGSGVKDLSTDVDRELSQGGIIQTAFPSEPVAASYRETQWYAGDYTCGQHPQYPDVYPQYPNGYSIQTGKQPDDPDMAHCTATKWGAYAYIEAEDGTRYEFRTAIDIDPNTGLPTGEFDMSRGRPRVYPPDGDPIYVSLDEVPEDIVDAAREQVEAHEFDY